MRMMRWQWVARTMGRLTTTPKAKPRKTGREPRRFVIVDGWGHEHVVFALTRSEGRAQVKKALGVKSLRTMTFYLPF